VVGQLAGALGGGTAGLDLSEPQGGQPGELGHPLDQVVRWRLHGLE
jgi:hypothetical protein